MLGVGRLSRSVDRRRHTYRKSIRPIIDKDNEATVANAGEREKERERAREREREREREKEREGERERNRGGNENIQMKQRYKECIRRNTREAIMAVKKTI